LNKPAGTPFLTCGIVKILMLYYARQLESVDQKVECECRTPLRDPLAVPLQ
jgi:hypothetical protein